MNDKSFVSCKTRMEDFEGVGKESVGIRSEEASEKSR